MSKQIFLFIILPSILSFELPFTIEPIHDSLEGNNTPFGRGLVRTTKSTFLPHPTIG